jgi:hypothetical protein
MNAGVSVEVVAVLDSIKDADLRQAVSDWQGRFNGLFSIHDVDFGSLSLSRNHGILKSTGRYISILDGDDLYGRKWLRGAYELCYPDKKRIAHPEVIFRFPIEPFLRLHPDNPNLFLNLIFDNQWPALTMAHRSIFERIPYIKDDENYAFQDWLWNCETAARDYTHIIVPQTLMAVRQKLPGKSLWHNSFSMHKVVRANALFRKVFLREFPEDVMSKLRVKGTAGVQTRFGNLLQSISIRLMDDIYAFHYPLYQAIIHVKHLYTSRLQHLRGFDYKNAWVYEQLDDLKTIDPSINPSRRVQIRCLNSRIRAPSVITEEMSSLVESERPIIYIVPKAGWNLLFLTSLCYIHATVGPIYIISTDPSGSSATHLLPKESSVIDLAKTGLIYEDRLRLMHRLLLESNPRFIHFFSSPFAMELFARYCGTFDGSKVFASFLSTDDDEQLGTLARYFSNFPHLFEFFQHISTDTDEYQKRLMNLFQVSETKVLCHSPPVVSWFPLDTKETLDSNIELAQGGRTGKKCSESAGRFLRLLLADIPWANGDRTFITNACKRLRRLDFHVDSQKISFESSLKSLTWPLKTCAGAKTKESGGRNSLRRDSVLVLTSHSIGTPFLAVQALGAGIPVITNNSPGLAEIINSGGGWSIDMDPLKLAGVIMTLASDPIVLSEARAKATSVASKFHSLKEFRQQVSEFYGIT